MDRTEQHKEGYRRASKDAVEWLYERAKEMNDPSAKAALNVAAEDMALHLKSVGK